MRVEILEERLRSDGYNFIKEDTITVPDAIGTKWCALGWAKDVSGAIATGERIVLNQNLLVDQMKIVQQTNDLLADSNK